MQADSPIAESLCAQFFHFWKIGGRQFAVQPASCIFGGIDRFKMFWIDTGTDTAEMVQLKPFKDGTESLLIVEAMCGNSAAPDADTTVSVLTERQLPNPARRLVSTIFNQIADVLAHVMVMDKPHRLVFHDAQHEVALRGNRSFLAAAAEAKAGWVRWWNLNSARQVHNPLQVDGGGTPGESRHLTSVSKADAQPHFCDVDWILA